MKIKIKWVQDVMFVGESESGHSVVMDGPPEGGGRNMGFRPMEMILLGTGGCTAYDVIHILKRSRQPVSDCKVDIVAERAEKPPKVFTKIHIHFKIYGKELNEATVKRAVDLTATKYCSASIMLSKSVAISHDYEILEV